MSCKCGYITKDCNVTGYVDYLSNEQVAIKVDKFLNGSCWLNQTKSCYISEGAATCECTGKFFIYKVIDKVGGVNGELCETMKTAIVWVLAVFGILVPALMFLYALVRIRKQSGTIHSMNERSGVYKGKASASLLFFYRLFCFLVVFIVLVIQWIEKGFPVRDYMMYFTLWNFHLMGLFFGVGAFFSFQSAFQDKKIDTQPMTTLEKLFCVVFEIEFTFTLYATVLVWCLLLPGAKAPFAKASLLNYGSYFQHGINVLFMLGELMLNGLKIRSQHIHFNTLWVSFYMFIHNLFTLIEEFQGKPHNPFYGVLDAGNFIFAGFVIGLLLYVNFFYYVSCFLSRKIKGSTNLDDSKQIHPDSQKYIVK